MMVLVDTSVWIDHFKNNNPQLIDLLNNGEVFCHQLIIGEMACGNLQNRLEILSLLKSLPLSVPVEHEELFDSVFVRVCRINIDEVKGSGYP